ncbi:MAG: insulinase family protein [Chitinispirillaceae bacterium]|nr:insulinase family protein [Chitinispirillaceae bacterium]
MRSILAASALLFLTVIAPCAGATQKAVPPHPEKIVYDSLRWSVPLGTPYRVELKNGLRAYIASDSTLPLVRLTVYVRCGTLLDPAEKEGATALMANLMRTGGTSRFNADTLDALLDRYAMRFSVKASEDLLQLTAVFLSDYTDTALVILQEMLLHPTFNEKKLAKEKLIHIEGVRHRFDNPGPTLDIAFQKAMYSGGPAAKLSTKNSIKRISRSDLVDLHKRTITTNAMILAMAGTFDRAAMIGRLEKIFPPTSTTAEIRFPEIKPLSPVRALVIHKPISQVYVRFGIPLFKRPHIDYYPVSVANLILGGGGFTSRLGTIVRSDAGLTYSIYSSAESNYTYPGTWNIEFFTKNESFPHAVALSLAVIDSIRTTGVTTTELDNAKASLIDKMPSQFRTAYDIVSTYAWNEYFGRSPDIFRVYADSIRVIPRQKIKEVTNRWLDPSSLTFTVVGDTAALAKYRTHGTFDFDKLMPRHTIPQDSITALP